MAGRPAFEITDKVIAEVEGLAARGLLEKQIAQYLGISYETLRVKKKQYSVFSAAIKKGAAKGAAIVTNELFTKIKDGDRTSTIFYLKCRVPGWTEKDDRRSADEKPDIIIE